jgi:hypothetical protein
LKRDILKFRFTIPKAIFEIGFQRFYNQFLELRFC